MIQEEILYFMLFILAIAASFKFLFLKKKDQQPSVIGQPAVVIINAVEKNEPIKVQQKQQPQKILINDPPEQPSAIVKQEILQNIVQLQQESSIQKSNADQLEGKIVEGQEEIVVLLDQHEEISELIKSEDVKSQNQNETKIEEMKYLEQSQQIFKNKKDNQVMKSWNSYDRVIEQFQIKEANSYEEQISHKIDYDQESEANYFNSKRSQRKDKEKKKLAVVKQHYKLIISELQQKLQQLCSKHNENIDMINPNQTITFSQQESYILYNQEQPVEMNVTQVNCLKEELEMHQNIITTLLQEEVQLKTKVRDLQQKNKQLLSIIQSPTQQISQKSQYKQYLPILMRNASQTLSVNKNELKKSTVSINHYEQSYNSNNIQNLYKSHIIESGKHSGISFLQSQLCGNAAINKSTISMMSILEGVLNVGLLGQCRFLNEINKKFIINQIKKTMKSKIYDTFRIYSYQQCGSDIFSYISERSNVLFLLKFLNDKKMALFVQNSINKKSQENKFSNTGHQHLLVIDLCNRKATNSTGIVELQQNAIVWNSEGFAITQTNPLTLCNCSLTKKSNKSTHLSSIIQSFQKQGLQIAFLQIYQLSIQSSL